MQETTQTTKTDHSLDIPSGLTKLGKKVAEAILKVAGKNGTVHTGGCRAFYSPTEWKARGESYGTKSILIVVHDGGDLAGYFNFDAGYQDRYERMERMTKALEELDVYAEACTGWYTAIYLA